MTLTHFSPELAKSIIDGTNQLPVDSNHAWRWLEYDGFKVTRLGESYVVIITDPSIKFRYGGWYPHYEGFLKISDEGLVLFVSMCDVDLDSKVQIDEQQLEWYVLSCDTVIQLFYVIECAFEMGDRFPSLDDLHNMSFSDFTLLMLSGMTHQAALKVI